MAFSDPRKGRAYSRDYSRRYRRAHKNETRFIETRRRVELRYARLHRTILIEILGGKCARCDFDDPRALQIDHVYGGGTRMRRERLQSVVARYYYVLANQEDFQVLCANCNWIKREENGEVN